MYAIIKNLIHVVRRFKLAAVLNILGLSVAFAAFMIIMMQLNFHFGFDRFHKNADKIFRLEWIEQNGGIGAAISRPLAELFFESSPHIIDGGFIRMWESNIFFYVENDGGRNFFQESSIGISPDFAEVFSFDIVEGSKELFMDNESVMIPLSLSRRLFGNESAIGRHLMQEQGGSLIVAAVYRDFPGNSILGNQIYSLIPEGEGRDNWNIRAFNAYIRVNQASNANVLIDNFMRNTDWGTDSGNDSRFSWRLTALPDIHFTTDVGWDNTPKANRQTLLVLFAIGIVIVIIAAINFTNFSTALTPMRIRNINTQRVMGAQQRTIRWILVIEAIMFSVVSYLVALLLVNLAGNSLPANLVQVDLSIAANLSLVAVVALVAIVVGVAAGLYPSRYMTSFAPALALKGNWGLSPKGKRIRNTLIAIQFIASFSLIIVASFMYLQNRFMQGSFPGYEKDALITVNIGGRMQENREAFINELKSYPGVGAVTFAGTILTADQHQNWGRLYRGEWIHFRVIPVYHNFLEVLGVEVAAGRNFRQEDIGMGQDVFIFNNTARQRFNLELNSMIGDVGQGFVGFGEVIGFIPDIQFTSFRMAMEPMAFLVWGNENIQHGQVYIRLALGANPREAMAHIRSTLAEFDPNYPFEVHFFDEVLQRLYEEEIRLGLLITLFSLIAILISIVGVFGLVVFDSECRRKEIGIRKVLGSSAMEIVLMFNKAYFRILLICFVIAVPVAWFAVSRWLENFAYRTPMHWWIFVLALVAVGIITALTVTIQNWRVANDDPVRSIKTE